MSSFGKCVKCENTIGEKLHSQFYRVGCIGSGGENYCLNCFNENKEQFKDKEIFEFTKKVENKSQESWSHKQIQWIYHCLDCNKKFATDTEQNDLHSPLTSCQQHKDLSYNSSLLEDTEKGENDLEVSQAPNQIKSNQIKSNQNSTANQTSNSNSVKDGNSKQTNYLPWILGGVGVVSLIGIIVYLLIRREDK